MWPACSCSTWRPQLPDGRSWDDAKEEFADLVIDTVSAHAPNFKASVLGRQVLSPLDLERRFGLLDGDIFHGQLTLDQLFSARPVLGHADYRMPVPGLYLCGSGAHPGGGVTGLPGRNAALEIIRDFKASPLAAGLSRSEAQALAFPPANTLYSGCQAEVPAATTRDEMSLA